MYYPREKVIKSYEHDECMVDITNVIGILKSTLRAICNKLRKLRKAVISVMRMSTIKITQIRVHIMEKLESMLEIGNSRHTIVDMARRVGFDVADEASVENCFSHSWRGSSRKTF
jgi:hypothetical protein